jgi:glycosyltransferase involved in cell wall biosynthesis
MIEILRTYPAPLVTVERTGICTDAKEPFLSFAMPAYNEQDNIETTISECLEAFKDAGIENQPVTDQASDTKWGEIVVTNDCSSDHTTDILAKVQESIPNLVVITHLEKNQGYGRALSDAIAASRGTWVATIDSDGQFFPGDLPDILEKLNDSGIDKIDCVAGFRVKKKDSGIRVFADRGLNLIVRILFGIGHRDTNCAFKLIRGTIIRNLQIETNGFQTPTEIVLKLNALNHPMVECGVTHRIRGEGKSKLKVIKTSMDFFRFLFYLRTKINLYRRKILARL